MRGGEEGAEPDMMQLTADKIIELCEEILKDETIAENIKALAQEARDLAGKGNVDAARNIMKQINTMANPSMKETVTVSNAITPMEETMTVTESTNGAKSTANETMSTMGGRRRRHRTKKSKKTRKAKKSKKAKRNQKKN